VSTGPANVELLRKAGVLPPPPADCYVLGLDLGRAIDPSALAVLQWARPAPGGPRPVYEVPLLKRWSLGTPYRQIVAEVAHFLKAPPLCQFYPVLALDATGVGAAVSEMCLEQFRAEGVRAGFVEIVITAGGAVTQDLERPGSWHVAKRQLASVLQVLLGNRRLLIAEHLADAQALKQELADFSYKVTEALELTWEALRAGAHDDLVLALAIASWAAEHLDVFKPKAPAAQTAARRLMT
jgi:hypothetical protein